MSSYAKQTVSNNEDLAVAKRALSAKLFAGYSAAVNSDFSRVTVGAAVAFLAAHGTTIADIHAKAAHREAMAHRAAARPVFLAELDRIAREDEEVAAWRARSAKQVAA